MIDFGRRQRILVADGDEDSLTRMVLRLGRAGYEVVVARDGEEALTRALADLPDLCVLDAVLPKLSGYDVTRRLRADPATHDVRVLLLSALPQEGTEFDTGADGSIRKPFSSDELRGRVRSLLGEPAPTRAASLG